jgi:hypothetical protein
VVSLNRLERLLSHLLAVIEGLQAKGAFARSLRDPVDTPSLEGVFTRRWCTRWMEDEVIPNPGSYAMLG